MNHFPNRYLTVGKCIHQTWRAVAQEFFTPKKNSVARFTARYNNYVPRRRGLSNMLLVVYPDIIVTWQWKRHLSGSLPVEEDQSPTNKVSSGMFFPAGGLISQSHFVPAVEEHSP